MENNFDITNKVCVISGGSGVLGGTIAAYLLKQHAKVVILGSNKDRIEAKLESLLQISSLAMGFVCDVLDKEKVEKTRDKILEKWGRIDVLLNIAGGNLEGATIGENQTIFDLEMDDFDKVTKLNLNGTVIPSIVFGKVMANQKEGVIINYSSMAAQRTITRVAGYSASKAAMENFTRWMSVEMATKFGDGIRVNALAPGFFVGNQNKRLLLNNDGSYTNRGKTIIKNTPMARFGKAEELNGAVHFLCSNASKFVTGVVIPVDGGFNAFSGV